MKNNKSSFYSAIDYAYPYLHFEEEYGYEDDIYKSISITSPEQRELSVDVSDKVFNIFKEANKC